MGVWQLNEVGDLGVIINDVFKDRELFLGSSRDVLIVELLQVVPIAQELGAIFIQLGLDALVSHNYFLNFLFYKIIIKIIYSPLLLYFTVGYINTNSE